jgi:hypothetical protein
MDNRVLELQVHRKGRDDTVLKTGDNLWAKKHPQRAAAGPVINVCSALFLNSR